jgi:glutathione S-transferase
MLKIWGRLSSGNVQKVVICANVLGLPYEHIEAGGKFGLVDTPAYRRMNPNGLVPTIDDDGFLLWESNAIVRYLARKHGAGTLFPADVRQAADSDRWMEWQSTTLMPAMGDAFLQLVRPPGPGPDLALVEASVARTEPRMAILDEQLADRAYVAGDTLTMGDIPVACAAHRWLGLPCQRVPRPHVERWLASLRERPAFGRVLTLPLT